MFEDAPESCGAGVAKPSSKRRRRPYDYVPGPITYLFAMRGAGIALAGGPWTQ